MKTIEQFEVGKKYVSEVLGGRHKDMIVECIKDGNTSFSGKVIQTFDRRVFTVGEVFNHFSKQVFEPLEP